MYVTKYSNSGRPQEITFKGAGGTDTLTGADAGGFVRWLGAGSSRVALSGLNPMTVQGTGQGHGVGLSQYGARGLARKGYDHLHILGFYYPGTVLSSLAGVQNDGPRLATLPENEQLRSIDAAQVRAQQVKNLLAGTPLNWSNFPTAPAGTTL